MANPTEQELEAAYGNYSQINYAPDNVLRTPESSETDLRSLRGRSEMHRLSKPQKKVSFTKKDKADAGRPLDIIN